MYQESVRDMREQLDALLAPGFLHRTPALWLPRLPVYLQAMAARTEKLSQRLPKDLECVWEMQALQQPLHELGAVPAMRAQAQAGITEYRWMLEEYRISLFAQQLGTRVPVSHKRLDKLWAEVRASL